METNREHNQLILAQERAVLKEWNYLQQSLFTFAHGASYKSLSARRPLFESYIAQITERQAKILEVKPTTNSVTVGSRLYEISYQHIRYGSLELVEGYLVSTFMPAIPRNFANFCALILYIGEHEELVQYQLAHLPPSIPGMVKKAFDTTRERCPVRTNARRK